MHQDCCWHAIGPGIYYSPLSLFLFCIINSSLQVANANLRSMLETDLVFIWWWKNNFHYSREWFCWRSVSVNAHSQWLHQESVSEYVFSHTFNRNHSNSIGLSSIFLHWSFNVTLVLDFKILTLQVPGDELKWVRCCTNDDIVAMASQNGMVILTSCENVCHLKLFIMHFKFTWKNLPVLARSRKDHSFPCYETSYFFPLLPGECVWKNCTKQLKM